MSTVPNFCTGCSSTNGNWEPEDLTARDIRETIDCETIHDFEDAEGPARATA